MQNGEREGNRDVERARERKGERVIDRDRESTKRRQLVRLLPPVLHEALDTIH